MMRTRNQKNGGQRKRPRRIIMKPQLQENAGHPCLPSLVKRNIISKRIRVIGRYPNAVPHRFTPPQNSSAKKPQEQKYYCFLGMLIFKKD